jgi:hypothetical protein
MQGKLSCDMRNFNILDRNVTLIKIFLFLSQNFIEKSGIFSRSLENSVHNVIFCFLKTIVDIQC